MITKQDILDRAAEWQLRPEVVEKDYVLGWRRLIVPKERERRPCSGTERTESGDADVSPAAARRISWSELMLRVFAIDVLVCPRCSGRMRIIATVTDPAAARSILECIGLAARPPPLSPARERDQGEFEFGG